MTFLHFRFKDRLGLLADGALAPAEDAALRAHLQISLGGDQGGQAGADELVIVGDDEAEGCHGGLHAKRDPVWSEGSPTAVRGG